MMYVCVSMSVCVKLYQVVSCPYMLDSPAMSYQSYRLD